MRELPEVALSLCPPEFARLAVQGFDTVQEAFALTPTSVFVDILEFAQAEARAASDAMDGVAPIQLGPERFHVHATGAKGGTRWRLENDDLLLLISSPKREPWVISVRYLSAGLWEHGLEVLRARVFAALRTYTVQRTLDCVRVSRADWCFDFYSPAFADEFRPGITNNVICHSGTKVREIGEFYSLFSCGGKGQTLDVGSKAGLQVSIYNKTLEIDEASGKTWLYPVWVAGLGERPEAWSEKPAHMFRLELRWSADFLKHRNVRRPFELIENLERLIAESLFTRRLSSPSSDSNRWRWPMHPIWSEAHRSRGAGEMLPIGPQVTGRRDALVDRAISQIAGSVRSVTVLQIGSYRDERARAIVAEAMGRVLADAQHEKKERIAMDRYTGVEDAR